jgi:predicted metalloprotease
MQYESGDDKYVEDRRGQGMMGRGLPIGLGGLVVLALLSWATGTDFLSLLGPAVQQGAPADSTTGPVESSPEEEKLKSLAGAVMSDLNEQWGKLLPGRYRPTTLVLFRDQVNAEGCGLAQSASGPFYCPGAQKVYLDLAFYQDLSDRFGAPGDFAQAYVVAHEVGHHVQTLLGIESQVRRAQEQRPELENQLSVRLELQADCFAGVWGHIAAQPGRFQREHKPELDADDAKEGLRAAAAIGDDRLQRVGGGVVSPERFTHGSSAQRVTWLKRGLESGSVDACDTFGTK